MESFYVLLTLFFLVTFFTIRQDKKDNEDKEGRDNLNVE